MAPSRGTSTIPSLPDIERLRRSRLLRRAFTIVLTLFLVLSLTGVLGVRTRTATGAAQGYVVAVTYAAMTRPGLATPWAVDVTRVGGFEEAVTVAVTSDYIDMFDENGLDPDPAIARADDRYTYWTFEIPPGDKLGVSFDARLEPAVQWGRDGKVLLIREGRTLLEVPFRTWVMP
jgi:hypothetical protein